MSDVAVPVLDDVELPTPGHWVAFRSGGDVYVLRGDAAQEWTLLSVRGTTVGGFRWSRNRYRLVDGPAAGRIDADWRQVVRMLVPTGSSRAG